ncbi:isochorismate synthase [Virgibacillus dakarensis]|uniref:Isochorismate synthase MenF n=1 Tax=Lentibacillus populi TaxID=1827502 RepID=A0A9W5X4U4_9BACI|nr:MULTISPECIES: isochorismate synthase [Bacillaceae]MBT2217057.1 isochorismate synthase [Virgibacillus dakarensis]MTW84653.1 isochorismate synthase [Virgibacillus dakarensis]GGB36849.1 menaquinone-specific isochorismate synthase [Lentibacillus populi]
MIETKKALLESLLDQAIVLANNTDSAQLVSFTKKIDEIDPLQFFEAAKDQGMNRTFWTSTADEFCLVGAGTVCHLIADENRFQETEKQWENLVSNALIHNPYQTPGTGLVALGGMRFDPKKDNTDLWKKFKNSEFRVPRLTLTKQKSAFYLTINTEVTKDDHTGQLAHQLRKTAGCFLGYTNSHPVAVRLKQKEEIAPEQWKGLVKQATDKINQNKAEKIVLAREMRLKLSKQPAITTVLKKLLTSQTNSYIFAFEHDDDCFVGATPERLVKLEQNQLLSTCLAGTAPRGKTTAEDKEISKTLLHDPKNRGEHDYVVQMIKNAIKHYCLDIQIPDKPVIYPLKNLQHLYTPVRATLKNGYSIFDIIKELHPTPALGGVPREASLTFIREYELLDRGWYGAPVGWLDSNQNGEFAVAIRSGLIQGDEASLFAGCGVVKDSDPEAEYEETLIKFAPMLSVLGG